MEMERKIASMKYGKIVFHSIPCPAWRVTTEHHRHTPAQPTKAYP